MNKRYIMEDFASFTNSSGDNFWGDVASGILPIAKSSGRILLNLRSDEVNEPLTYGVYGGKLDHDDLNDREKAAKREFIEETGYKGLIETKKAFLFKTSNGSFEYQNYIGEIESEFDPTYDWESSGHKWVTFDELLEMIKENPNKIHFGLRELVKESGDLIKNITSKYEK